MNASASSAERGSEVIRTSRRSDTGVILSARPVYHARMDFPFGGDPEAFADAPLFRELQRVMASSSGPVNWELARQVGIAGAQEGREDPAPSEADRRSFEEAVRVAELHVARFTGLEPPRDVASVEAVRIAQWVTANTEGLRELLE